jgi:hypothetical protein
MGPGKVETTKPDIDGIKPKKNKIIRSEMERTTGSIWGEFKMQIIILNSDRKKSCSKLETIHEEDENTPF